MSSYKSYDGRSCECFLFGKKLITVAKSETVLSIYIQEKGKRIKVIKTQPATNLTHTSPSKLFRLSSVVSSNE